MKTVSKRAVYFLGGFDPRGGRHYYSLYKTESAKMAQCSNAEIEVSNRKNEQKNVIRWDVQYTENDQTTHTEFRTLDYSDIIRNHWSKTEIGVIKGMLQAYLFLWKHKFFTNGIAVSKYVIIVAVSWSIFLFIALLAGAAAITISLFVLTSAYFLNLIIGIVLACIIIFTIGYLFDKKFNHYWLLRGITFSGMQKQYADPDYESRMNYFSEIVKQADQSGEYDEILIVGHSSGAIWASELAARCESEDDAFATRSTSVNVLTLGNCFALMAGSTFKSDYQKYLYKLAQSQKMDWLDFVAKIDLAAAFDTKPAKLLEKYQPEDFNSEPLPRFIPARFFKVFSDTEYKRLKKDRYRTHFQYLMASETDGEYNYFRMTSGSKTLREQFPIS